MIIEGRLEVNKNNKNPVGAAAPKQHNIDPAWNIIDHFLVHFSIFLIIM